MIQKMMINLNSKKKRPNKLKNLYGDDWSEDNSLSDD